MDFDALWIGDAIFFKKAQKNAVWEGKASAGMAKIKIDGEQVTVPISELSEATEEEEYDQIELQLKEQDAFDLKAAARFKTSIDLHMERLAPDMQSQLPEMILHHQISRCKAFIQSAIKFRKNHITIIHGKGTGALKTEVEALVNTFSEVYFTNPSNAGGATEVTLKY